MKTYREFITSTKTSKKKGGASSARRKKAKHRSGPKPVSKPTPPPSAVTAPSFKVRWIRPDDISVNLATRCRPVMPGLVKTFVQEIPTDGLRTPLTITWRDGVAHLVAGLQRLEALILLGWKEVPYVCENDELAAQRWQITENLHRGELTKLQRANQTAALLALSSENPEEISGEKVQKKKRGRPQGGDAKAAREIMVRGKTDDAKRKNIAEDRKISDIHEDAQQALTDAGLEDNGRALRAVSSEPTREAQLAKVKVLAKRSGYTGPSTPGDDADDADDTDDAEPPLVVLKRAWKKAKKVRVAYQNASPEDRRAFIIEDLGYPLDEEPEDDDEDDDEADD
jgi:ParB-like chromosome segregation protein Spo0J